MSTRIDKVYEENLSILRSLNGLEILAATQEKYFFEGKLDEESMGDLKIVFSDKREVIFRCDVDADSINIQFGGFSNRGTLEEDFKDGRYTWREEEYLTSSELACFGKIIRTEIEVCISSIGNTQSGCRISFQNGQFLYIWIISSDNIFYGMDTRPPYYQNADLKVNLTEVS